MQYDEFVSAVMHRTGIQARERAERAIDAALEVLGERLLNIDSKTVAERLPRELARSLRRHGYLSDFSLDELYGRVSQREGVAEGFAREHVQVIFQVLSESVDDSARAHLGKRLPPELAELFVLRASDPRAVPLHPYQAKEKASGTTLASGRPGTHRPLNEAHGQSGSVVEAGNPHFDSKISSSGVSAEREGRTLSTGKPGSTHSISDFDG